jgi:hypothetical protein
MDILKMLADLRAEREQIEEAIVVLERLAAGHGKRRGRPPAWMAKTIIKTTNEAQSGRKRFSMETRKRMAEAQQKRWAERKKAEGK